MKKTILLSAIAVISLLIGFSFTSCSDDDNALVGTWYNESIGERNGVNWKYYTIYTFKSDGTGSRRDYRWDSRDGEWMDDTDPFVYTIISDLGDHGVVRRTYTTGKKWTGETVYSIVGNILSLGDQSYQKGSPSI